MSIVAVVGNKGGTGKTTLSLNLAAGQARRGSVVVVDADPQQSAYQWRLIGNENAALPVVVAAAFGLEKTVKALRDVHDHVVIDCPPSIKSPQTEHALRLADHALIPLQPSPMDLWATSHLARIIEMIRPENPRLRTLIVINQMEPRTTLSRLMLEAVAELDLPVARASLQRRSIHRLCVLEGHSVFQAGRRVTAGTDRFGFQSWWRGIGRGSPEWSKGLAGLKRSRGSMRRVLRDCRVAVPTRTPGVVVALVMASGNTDTRNPRNLDHNQQEGPR